MVDGRGAERENGLAVEPVDEARSTQPDTTAEPLAPGVRVEVRNRLDGRWTRGFEVVGHNTDGYRLRRLSDGMELPLPFASEDVRRERRRGTWWY